MTEPKKISRNCTEDKPLPVLSLRVVSTSRSSITLTWAHSFDGISEWNEMEETLPLARTYYRLQMKDRTNRWTTAYWGYKTQVHIEPLSPGESYYFRLQVGKENKHGDWSTVATSTKVAEDLPSMIILHRSIAQGLPHRARKFLSLRPQCVDLPDRAGRPALLVAAQRGDAEMVQLLLAGGADPNGGGGVFASGRTPLMAAAAGSCGDRPDVCRALCDRGARWDLKDRNGRTALHYAAGAGHIGFVQMALEMNKDGIHDVDGRGWTPLMHAAMLGADLDVLSTLTKAAPSTLRKTDRLGLTPLHVAALTNQREAFAIFIELGGDPRQKDFLGKSALQLLRFWAPPSGAVGAVAVDATLSVAAAAAALLRTRKRLPKPAKATPTPTPSAESKRDSRLASRCASRRASSLVKVSPGKAKP